MKNLLELIEAIWKGFCPPRRRRLDLQFLPYGEADELMRCKPGVWTIAPEEDNNRNFGWVYIERLEQPAVYSTELDSNSIAPGK